MQFIINNWDWSQNWFSKEAERERILVTLLYSPHDFQSLIMFRAFDVYESTRYT